MSVQKIAALIVIFIGSSIAWVILGTSNWARTNDASSSLKSSMQSMYGDDLVINAPTLYKRTPKGKDEIVFKDNYDDDYQYEDDIKPMYTKETKDGENVVYVERYAKLESSEIKIDVKMDRRKKGYLWFPTFKSHFVGTYKFVVEQGITNEAYYLSTIFGSSDNIYTNVKINVNGRELDDFLKLLTEKEIVVQPNDKGEFLLHIEYDATGMENLRYKMANGYKGLTQVNNFNCEITTDFEDYDFPRTMLSPTTKKTIEGGALLSWNFSNTITGKDIGLIIPNKLNPGEITSRVSFFAPIPLLFFFIVLLMISIVTHQEIHAMHFFFLALAFFSFHLMFSYFSDQMHIYLSFAIAALVSLGLTVSYVMHFLSKKMAFLIIPLTQIVYLFVFSFSFFFDGITGLIVTICAVTTLFILMQLTAKQNWNRVFNPEKEDERKTTF